MKKMKDFSFLFSFALLGACIYKLIVYLADPYSPNWPELIREILVVSALVSAVLLAVKAFANRPANQKN
ncbi:MAG TPA: hypothetical protein VK112_07040 [Fodinibius sp.]|nr:hypothetical protein [Fodinibius sp.]